MNSSAMLWNFDEGMMNGEPDSLGTSSIGSENDPLSMLLSSMVQKEVAAGMLSNVVGISSASSPTPNERMLKCQICMEAFCQPKVLACFHSFCKNCLQRQLEASNDNRLVCPQCYVETQLSAQLGIEGLLSDYGLEKVARALAGGGLEEKGLIFGSPSSTSSSPPLGDICDQNSNTTTSTCTGCKSGEKASAYCCTCLYYLCTNCTLAHRYMHCFEGHRVEELSSSGVSSGIASSASDSVSPPSIVSAAVAAAAAALGNGQPQSLHKSSSPINNANSSHCKCLEHRSQPLRYFCNTCNLAICRDCMSTEHQVPHHNVENIDSVAEKQIGLMETLISEAHKKQTDLHQMFKLIDAGQNRLNLCFQQAQQHIDEITNCLIQLVQEARRNITKELENIFGYKQLQLTLNEKEVQKMVKKMSQTIEFTQRLLKYSSPTEVMVFKPLLDTRLQGFLTFNANVHSMLHSCEIRTQSIDIPRARQGIFSLMNILQPSDLSAWNTADGSTVEPTRQSSTSPPTYTQQQQFHHSQSQTGIGRPLSRIHQSSPPVGSLNGASVGVIGSGSFQPQSLLPSFVTSAPSTTDLLRQQSKILESEVFGNGILGGDVIGRGESSQSLAGSNGLNAAQLIQGSLGGLSSHHHHHLTSAIGTSAPAGGVLSAALDLENSLTQGCSLGTGNTIFNQYEKWSSGLDPSTLGALSLNDPETITDLSILASSVENKNGAFPLYPPRSQIKRQKMTYHCRFGEFGVMEGQFTEPSGVAVNAQNHIVVADTNNHRIQVFDKEGRFKFQFGECGKRDGQLLYPNRVSVNRVTGDFIVTERSPTHQIQIYNQYGQFLRKFGANILQHPRGVCVDNQGRIIVVECKVMRVIIFDAYGNIIQKFSCSRYLEFPNGVCANDKNEILISDNRAHCIKVFNYEGHYVRQIGGEGITNYPIGVGINENGEVIVADNHNNFNLTVFSQDGTMLSALESKVKHAQCFDVALVEDGSVVLASKDYRLYLYRYQQQHSGNGSTNGQSILAPAGGLPLL